MKISIMGLGYVGLPLALQADISGHEVIGVDKKEDIIDKTNKKIAYIGGSKLNKLIKKSSLKAMKNVESSEAYIVCVPTPVDSKKNPDLNNLKSAIKEISKVVKSGQIVIIESTVYPGVCEDIVKPLLDKYCKGYLLAHCPERINPGDEKWDISNIPRVIGGINKKSAKKCKELYSSIVNAELVVLKDIKSVESTKILENIFRDVNIALVNEMAQSFYRMGIDITEVIRGASSKPFGFMPHFPGVGVGGHCIAVDPYYMIQKGKDTGFDHDFLIQARKINSGMPTYVLKLLQNSLNDLGMPIKGTKIAILGLSYKPDISDDRESPSYEIIRKLENKGANLNVYDPHVLEKSNVKNIEQALCGVDCVLITTAHKEFKEDLNIYKNIKLIVDGRNCLNKEEIKRGGSNYKGIGRR